MGANVYSEPASLEETDVDVEVKVEVVVEKPNEETTEPAEKTE